MREHRMAAVLMCVLACGARAADGDPEAGRRKTVTCNGCHAQSGMQAVPNLGGQRPAYFIAAMRAYQDGKRSHATMRDVAKAYSDRELKNFAAHYAQFLAVEEGGEAVANAVAAPCEVCHGPRGREPAHADSAVLAGQKPAYLKTVLMEYRDGTRRHGVMGPVAANLSDADIDALAAYFSGVMGLLPK